MYWNSCWPPSENCLCLNKEFIFVQYCSLSFMNQLIYLISVPWGAAVSSVLCSPLLLLYGWWVWAVWSYCPLRVSVKKTGPTVTKCGFFERKADKLKLNQEVIELIVLKGTLWVKSRRQRLWAGCHITRTRNLWEPPQVIPDLFSILTARTCFLL